MIEFGGTFSHGKVRCVWSGASSDPCCMLAELWQNTESISQIAIVLFFRVPPSQGQGQGANVDQIHPTLRDGTWVTPMPSGYWASSCTMALRGNLCPGFFGRSGVSFEFHMLPQQFLLILSHFCKCYLIWWLKIIIQSCPVTINTNRSHFDSSFGSTVFFTRIDSFRHENANLCCWSCEV